MKRGIRGIFFLLAVFLAAGCRSRRPVTRNLEEIHLNPDASAVIQAIQEYQMSASETYRYANLGDWLDLNRTASIYGAAPGRLRVLTKDTAGNLQWRNVEYRYPFYDASYMEGSKKDGEGFLLFSLPQISADCQAAAWKTLVGAKTCIVVEEQGKPAVLLDEKGRMDGEEEREASAEAEDLAGKENLRLSYTWSADGRTLLYYQAALIHEQDEEGETIQALQFPAGIYGYDRETGENRMLWEPMKLYLPGENNPYLYPWEGAAGVAGEKAVLFLLFQDDAFPDVMLLKDGDRVETRLLRLPDHPCIQIEMEEKIYYYQEQGEVRRAAFSRQGQSEIVVATDSGMESFLVSKDGEKVFTIESRGETKDIFLYLRDEKGNWYKQALYVGADGAHALQMSEEQQILLVECRGEEENEALILRFAKQE